MPWNSISRTRLEVIMSRVQLALNVDDLDAAVTFSRNCRGSHPPNASRLRQLRRRRATVEARTAGNPGKGGSVNHLA